MKKTFFSFLLVSLLSCPLCMAADSQTKTYQGSGEVLTVDPVYSQLTIQHKAIKGFSGDRDSEFYVSSNDLLKGVQKGDLVDFELTDTKGDVKIVKMTKTGVALPKDDTTPLGQVVQDVLVGTGEVAKGVTQPIAPAHEVVGGTVDATTGATENVLKDARPEQKTEF